MFNKIICKLQLNVLWKERHENYVINTRFGRDHTLRGYLETAQGLQKKCPQGWRQVSSLSLFINLLRRFLQGHSRTDGTWDSNHLLGFTIGVAPSAGK